MWPKSKKQPTKKLESKDPDEYDTKTNKKTKKLGKQSEDKSKYSLDQVEKEL